jgi:hypothetical protein
MFSPYLTVQQIENLRREDAQQNHGAWRRPREPKREGRFRRAMTAMRGR